MAKFVKSKKFVIGAALVGVLVIAAAGVVMIPKLLQSTQSDEDKKANLPKQARLEIFKDNIQVKKPTDAAFIEGTEGLEIVEGTIIKTNTEGRGQVLYPNGSTTRIDTNSEITIAKYSEGPFEVGIKITAGRIWNRVSKLLGNETYKTESGTVVATVRGTSYGHEISKDSSNAIIVTKGVVATNCFNKLQASEISDSQKGEFDCKAKVPKLALITPTDKTNEWFTLNQEEDIKLTEMFGDVYKDDIDALDESETGFETPTPTPISSSGPIYKLDPIKLTPTLIFFTPTPTPTTNSVLKLDTSINKTILGTLATPTPTPTTSTFQLNPNLLNTTTILKTATPTPAPTLNTNLIVPPSFILHTPTPTPLPTLNTNFIFRP